MDSKPDEKKAWLPEKHKKKICFMGIALLAALIGVGLYMSGFPRKKPETIAREYTSETGWMMICDTKEHMLFVFTQSPDADLSKWVPVYYNSFPCSIGEIIEKNGKRRTRTPLGVAHIRWKQRYCLFDDCRTWYNSWMEDSVFGIHSTPYMRDEEEPLHEIDDRLGMDISNRCIRVKLKVAKWIYKTFPEGTPLIVY
ncbi:MAG: L,D-transpeptidase [Eubacteriales bacterium]|nr:L,D-transpeptidase [Eubacteriales bacterium]